MQIGYIGLGKMGKNMVERLLEKKHQVVAWNRSPEPREEVAKLGATVTESVAELVAALPAPRVVWVMLPAKDVTNAMLKELSSLLQSGDIVIDGGNSHYTDTQTNAEILHARQLRFLDVGTSGGPAGARSGACLMIGGDQDAYTKLQSLFVDLAAPGAVQFFAGAGAGHFVKMVHNGIEYGMMQALAEGFAVLKAAPFGFDLPAVAAIYNNQSVIASRLTAWLHSGLQAHDAELSGISGTVAQSGEGAWTVLAAKALGVPVPIIAASLQFRLDSVTKPSYIGQVLSLLRHQFGGHAVQQKT